MSSNNSVVTRLSSSSGYGEPGYEASLNLTGVCTEFDLEVGCTNRDIQSNLLYYKPFPDSAEPWFNLAVHLLFLPNKTD